MRTFLFAAVIGVVFCPAGLLPAATNEEIIPETQAEQHGLARPWMTQVQLDRGRARVRDFILYEGTLYIQSTRAMIHAIDAETGRTLWARQVGRADHPNMTPGAYRDLLATVNGSRLYVMNRYNGEILFETQVNGAPGGGPALSGKRAYVPMVTGMVLAYRLEPMTDPLKELGKAPKKDATDEEKKALEEERRQNIRINQQYVPPLACQSAGRALIQPLVTLQNADEEFVAWGTDRGYLNIGRVDRRSEDSLIIKYRLSTGDAIVSQPCYMPPDPKVLGDSGIIYTTSRDGYIYAVLERGGELLWKFSVVEPVVEPPVLIEDRIFAATQGGGMYCLDAKSGKQVWWTADILRFVSASKRRIYAADKVGRIRVLDAKSGSVVDVLPTEMLPIKMTNSQTDRLYLATDAGLVQCFRELEQEAPIHFGESRKPPMEEDWPKPPAKVSGKYNREAAGEKPARPKPAAKDKPAAKPKPAKKAKADDTGFDDAAGADDADAKPDKKKAAKNTGRQKADKKKKGKADDGGDAPAGGDSNPFGK